MTCGQLTCHWVTGGRHHQSESCAGKALNAWIPVTVVTHSAEHDADECGGKESDISPPPDRGQGSAHLTAECRDQRGGFLLNICQNVRYEERFS